MKQKIIYTIALMNLILLGGCNQNEPIPITPPIEENHNPCVQVRDYNQVEGDWLPENITIDNNITIDFDKIPIDKFNIFNMSQTIKEVSNGLVEIRLYDCDYMPIYSEDDYTRCGITTITRLMELNATDILYDVCVSMPRICKVNIKARFRDDEHKLIVCWE